MELYREMQDNVVAQERADAKTAEIFAFFDEVCTRFFFKIHSHTRQFPSFSLRCDPGSVLELTCTAAVASQIYAKWKELPLEDVQAWTLLTAETQSAVNHPR